MLTAPTPAENIITGRILRSLIQSGVWFFNSSVYGQVKLSDTHLPKVTHDGRIGPGVLCIYAHLAVFKDDKREWFIKPPARHKKINATDTFTKTKANPDNVFVFLRMASTDCIHPSYGW